jgi:hypothetical protein
MINKKGVDKVRYLHIMSNDKFEGPCIEFLARNFDINEHIFVFIGELKHNKYIEEKYKNNILKIKNKKDIVNILRFIKSTYKSKKIFLHGLFYEKIVQFLFFQPWLLKKCNWVIWGGDLYFYQKPKITIKQKVYEFMRAFCIKKFNGLITYIRGDYELAKKWYRIKGKYYECFMYPSNLYKEIDFFNNKNRDEKIYIQIGNSADPSNNHKEIIEKIRKYRNENIEIICPLSYGNKEYAEEIKKLGESIFGNKFIALMDFIPFEEYINILGKIDIAIFNHKRQQAMGNTITLLGLGKKVYLRNDVTQWKLFYDLGIKVYSVEDFNIKKIDNEIRLKNKEIVKKYFSEENLIKQLRKIFK